MILLGTVVGTMLVRDLYWERFVPFSYVWKEVSEVTPIEGWAFTLLCIVAMIAVIFLDLRKG